jgi:glycosyltransferase involved in cell wall biosynthesis
MQAPNSAQVKNRSFPEEPGTEFARPANGSASGTRPRRLAILISHPVQYFSPLFQRLAQQREIDLTVLYCSLQGAKKMKDPGFGISFSWDIPLLEGYRYKELRNFWPGQLTGFFSCTNPGVIAELRKGDYDAVIVFGWGSLTAWLAFAGAKFAGIPWMLYGDTNVLQENRKNGLKALLRRALLTGLFGRTAAFLASGSFNRAFYESMGARAERCFAAPMGIDNESFMEAARAAQARRQEIRREYGIPPGLILMLFSGKLAPHKRPQDLLGVLEILHADFPRLGGMFVGDGVLRKILQEDAARRKIANVFFLGFKNQTELPQIYSCADCLVLTSSTDTRSVVVNEAMACGLPVIVSDRTGMWGPGDVVRHGENGFVYPCGDMGALALAVRKLATDPDLRRRMGNRSREIIQDFGQEKCVEGIVRAVNFVDRQKRCGDGRLKGGRL